MAEIPIERLKELRSFANKGRDLHSQTAIDLLQEIDRLRAALAEKEDYIRLASTRYTEHREQYLEQIKQLEADRDAAIRERDNALAQCRELEEEIWNYIEAPEKD